MVEGQCMKKVLLIVGLIIVFIVTAGGVYFWHGYQKFMTPG